MLSILESFQLNPEQWFWVILCALFVGMAKTGIAGVGMLIVPILATIFGGKTSTGILLPMLCIADVFAVSYYHRHAEWKYIWKLMPSTVAGVLVGLYVGSLVNDQQFKLLMACIILVGLVIMVWRERKNTETAIPHNWMFSSIAGLLGGFSTMIGNAAGPVMAIYFLSMMLPKNSFIGTGAWFFLIINLFKVPFHISVWKTIDLNTFVLDLAMFPAIMIGAILGFKLVKLIPEKPYRIFIIASTALAAIKLFF
ncbi:MAG: sulfite exporter TauE/SafE family protein [Cyclobacteriaceae bacterium]|nr:sulfite exporter TauE/SafE family protein [Cyclobacteriaceae bacterium]MCK5210854.1 sulfite exporter TauE/SafE family protein [Cyclobacteriaceae bacterium]MCK5277964.1 sulfite exporter TauE/SafE family protein [Cyclobacteriaceae bacterium]MCK5368876.1 sulfite exporter TauE/SafE family protein [Cyclobacteriaceae bacterium]MCK5470170.1 sulfite exporter TauE/SafE family protein [Cyclobacteriaceae bacterium]